jgi:hypothetical protein
MIHQWAVDLVYLRELGEGTVMSGVQSAGSPAEALHAIHAPPPRLVPA